MQLNITRLPDGREAFLRETWDPKELDLEVPGWNYRGALDVEARAQRDSGIIKVKAILKAALFLTCSRCHKEFSKPLDLKLDLVYPLDLSQRTIELGDDIREELMLTYPQKILCREDCRGLCIRCGADLNESACICKRDEQ